MTLTQAQLAWCAAVLGAGTAGYHAPPVVKKAKAHVAKAQGKPAQAASPSRQPAPASPVSIPDCPIVSAPGAGDALGLSPLAGPTYFWADGAGPVLVTPGWQGGGSVPGGPAVPAPDVWVTLVAGFGTIGLALRKRKAIA